MFAHAVRKQYWYQMYIDDLPVWGIIGEHAHPAEGTSGTSTYIFAHQGYTIGYNGDRIVDVSLSNDNRIPLIPGKPVAFSYSVTWVPSERTYEERFSKYLDPVFFEHHIHWFSILNSFMMVIFLFGLVSMIFIRTLRNDISKFSKDDDELDLERLVDESGWKQVHGDVFRKPQYLSLLSALIGVGHHLALMAFLVIGVAFSRTLYIWRGAVTTSIITIYTLTSFVGGYSSGSYYKLHKGKHWKLTFIMTLCLFPAIGLIIGLVLNFLAVGYASSASIPWWAFLQIFSLFFFAVAPLTLAGTLYARRRTISGDFPCRVTSLPRPIFHRRWFTAPYFLAVAGGILPFGSIFIEMYFIFTSFWNYKFYYVYGFMCLMLVILIVVVSCTSVVVV